jgi:GDPmannose 4,6-dehydratase
MTMAKRALITGITGQDGSYLAELLLEKGYKVFGLQRHSSYPNTYRIDHLINNPEYPNFLTGYGDLSDNASLFAIIEKCSPDEIYNLGAQSHVAVSFSLPEHTLNTTGLGTLRILEVIRQLKTNVKLYQAGSSEMFGKVKKNSFQNERTPFNPQSPYGLAKVLAFQTTKVYRNSYHIFASNGILFNHESPRRGIRFVTRKITLGLSRIKLGLQDVLMLGNLNSKRDWGYARDYVEGIYKILQYKNPEDFVLATGQTHSVREFVQLAAKQLGIDIAWKGSGVKEKGIDRKTGKIIVKIDPVHFRPSEVDYLLGDSSKAKKLLGWKPKVSFEELVNIMIKHDYDQIKQESKLGRKIKVRHRFY